MKYTVSYIERVDNAVSGEHEWAHRSRTFRDKGRMAEFYKTMLFDDRIKSLTVMEVRDMTREEIIGA